MKRTLSFAVAVAIAHPAFAEDSRQLDAHEHGVGELSIAIEGTTVAMELHAPGADIVGFEYEAKSAEDRAAIDAAVATLAKPQDLFVFPGSAECTVTQASAELESEEDHEEHSEGDKHEEHDDHAEGGHEDEKHEEHAEGEHHDEHADEAGHTEFHAEYVLSCANPSAIDEITFAYFETFDNARELEVQIVTSAGAQAFEVERDEPVLDLRGML
ncbi:zinc uptake protein ZrgA [Ruegeria profundi]|uniref:Zinc-binding protein n=1 Tax=Ruegeria profundi TaxID=1685378 RepID=A0A0X3TXI0_9RHOB|nr:DUF2796 domain-containing protein [Ruegeria profundi]KUJ79256.1 hypothetical protein AVO44_08440 [Ruegeria profundi]